MTTNLSTGPRSAEGKAVSRFNALKTGIYAKGEVVLPTENFGAWEKFTSNARLKVARLGTGLGADISIHAEGVLWRR